MKNKKKIIILGATGFIGRNLLIYFANNKKYETHALRFKSNKFKIKNVKWHKIDLRNYEEVENLLKGFDIVIQAAATTSGSKDIVSTPSIHVTDNAVMNSYILKSSFVNKIKHLIFFSCTVMYKNSRKAIKESDYKNNSKINFNYFGVANTKIYIEKMCEFYSNISQTKFTVIRHSNIYGSFDKFDFEKSHFFGATISKVLLSKNEVTIWGKGKESRDLLYIDDLVNFVKLAIDKQKNKFRIYNCGIGKAYSINYIVKKIIQLSNKKLIIKYDPSKPSIKTSLFLDINLALKELNWKPKVSLEEGISKTIKWWKININKNSGIYK